MHKNGVFLLVGNYKNIDLEISEQSVNDSENIRKTK